MDDWRAKAVAEIEWSVREKNVLRHMGIHTLGELSEALDRNAFYCVPNCGKVTINGYRTVISVASGREKALANKIKRAPANDAIWQDFLVSKPPQDGRWICAVFRDSSGAIFVRWHTRKGEWVGHDGADAEVGHLHYLMWTSMPAGFRPISGDQA